MVNGMHRRRDMAESGDEKEAMLVPPPSGGAPADLFSAVRQAFEAGHQETLLRHLDNVQNRKEAEIEELCKSHYDEFIASVDELRSILLDADNLRREVSGGSSQLQHIVEDLLSRADSVLQHHTLRRNLLSASKLSAFCVRLLELCLLCNSHLSAGRYYPALTTLELIQNSRFHLAPLPSLLKLAIQRHIPRVKLHIEAKACRDFEDWLAHIRATSKEVGKTALARAESASHLYDPPDEDPCLGPIDERVHPDLGPLLRAHQAYTMLGMREKFGELYARRRYAQLDSDLQVSDARPFLEYYRSFIDQIAGHFLVESRVFRAAKGLVAEELARTMWETALRKLKTLLEEHLGRIETPTHVVAVRDRVRLLCATLAPYGYEVGPLIGAVNDARERYHDLLLEDCRRILSDLLTADTYERVVFRSEAEYESAIGVFGLREVEKKIEFPLIATFSSAVPDTCRVIQSFIEASSGYLTAGENPPGSAERYLDRLADLLGGILLEAVRRPKGFRESESVQLAANMTALERACAFFFRAGSRALKTARGVAISALVEVAKSMVDAAQDDVAGDVASYMDGLMGRVREVLPEGAVREVGNRLFGHVAEGFIAAFVGDGVRRFDPGVVGRVDCDLGRVEAVAGRLGERLEEARQLVDLLMSAEPERYAEKEERERRYGSLDANKVAVACDRYRDAGEGIFGSLGARQSAKKRSMEVLKRRLKESGLVV